MFLTKILSIFQIASLMTKEIILQVKDNLGGYNKEKLQNGSL